MLLHSTPLLSLIFSLFIVAISADVLYPVHEQLPLIARIGQPYSWSISSSTFSDQNVTASSLPSWLTFSNLTFSGTPSANDEGSVNITLSNGNSVDKLSICVTHFPPPTQNISLASQLTLTNPSMSSVFFLSPHSGLMDNNPAVRVPLHWSFSIGFDGGTFVNQHNLFYYARLANGSLLPDWIVFNGNTVTFDGVARSPPVNESDRLQLVLIASDQEGYSAVRAPFDLLVYSHELRSAGNGITLNATIGEDFELDFKQDEWVFAGVMVDNSTIDSDNITSLVIDSSASGWLSYDPSSQKLSGKAPSTSGSAALPMTITAFNQSLLLNSTITVLPSFFTEEVIPQTLADPDSDYTLSLSPYISKDSVFQGHDIDVSVSSNCSFLNLTRSSSNDYNISGHIPLNPSTSYSDFSFTAYDHTTHAASHASLRINFRVPASDAKRGSALAQRQKLVLGLGISIGTAVGLVILAGLLAVVRKYCREKDTAMDSVDNEKVGGYGYEDQANGYGWTEKMSHSPGVPAQNYHSPYPNLGITRTPTLMPGSPPPRRTTKGAFFTNVKAAVRNFSAGSSMRRKSAISKPMLIFTKESEDSLRALRSAAGLDGPGHGAQSFVPGGFGSPMIDGGNGDSLSLGSGIRTANTSSTGHSQETEQSVPRQRADFGLAPRDRLDVSRRPANPFAHMPLLKKKAGKKSGPHSRTRSDATEGTQSSGEHDAELEEAVIVTGSRATSLRSARSSNCSNTTSAYNRDSVDTAPARPRLVQFTSARGVPAPMPTQSSHIVPAGPRENRRVSQIAAVVSPGGAEANADTDADAIMTEGMRYVRAFGDQNANVEPTRPTRSNSKRSSRTRGALTPTTTSSSGSPIPTQSSYIYPSPSQSVDSGARDGKFADGSSKGSRGSLVMSRIIVRSGEAFVFKYPVLLTCGLDPKSQLPTPLDERRQLIARLLYSGGALPSFLYHAASAPTLTPSSSGKKWRSRYEVEFWGTPSVGDVGEVVVGIYTVNDNKEECVGRLVVDVVARG